MNRNRPAYAQTTITVPRELKRRMKAVRNSVNWSSIACQAFETKLKELSFTGETQSMKDVVERLRKLKQEQTGNESFRTGESQGRLWAMNVAHPDQLDRLEAFRAQKSASEWQALFATELGWRELARAIEPAAGPKRPGSPAKEKAVWKRILERPGQIADMEFFRGFAEGAIAVWKEVRDQL